MQGKIDVYARWLGELQLHAPTIIWQQNTQDKLVIQNINITLRRHVSNIPGRLNEIAKLDVQ